MLKLYNTLTREKEVFKPLGKGPVRMYACGPTVYWYAHIGNLRTYIFEDVLRRVLEYNGFRVKEVMNITDVGHLTSDADTGEDKIEAGARRERKTAWEIADFYSRAFRKDIERLNIEEPSFWVKATEHIPEQIKLIQLLEKKGCTYKIRDGIYFDTSRIKDYGKLTGPKIQKLKPGARVEVVAGKKNPTDFALWKFTPANVKRQMEWDSPWGRGFPGWHTECVAMAIEYLGIPFDIHCGGIDHIPIHHTNEIAQAEAAFNKELARFWLHGEFLTLTEGRMGKSEGNIITLDNLIENGFHPLAYRYLCLTVHYRSKLNFSRMSLEASQNALDSISQKIREFQKKSSEIRSPWLKEWIEVHKGKFLELINDDLNTPGALALFWDVIKSIGIPEREKYTLIMDFDKVLGLGLKELKEIKIPPEVKRLAELREKYRQENKWGLADEIREKIKELGYWLEDTPEGPKIKKLD